MSARPPLPPSHEPLDADEAAVARAYRALPGGDPSPDLDARILSQARAAVIPSQRRKRQPRPWFLGAGFGAAAAAVMAAGVAWQLGWLGGIPGASTTPAASQRSDASAPKRVEPAAAETIDIDYVKEERKAKDDAPAAAKPSDRRRQNAKLAPPPAAPAAPPAPPQEPARDERPMHQPAPVVSTPEPQPFPAEAAPAPAAAADAVLGATAARAATEHEGMAEQDAGGAALGRVAKQIAALPPWNEDERLPPAAWLERIRERVNRGERQGAEYSLRRFVQVHPQLDVPRELQRLLVE